MAKNQKNVLIVDDYDMSSLAYILENTVGGKVFFPRGETEALKYLKEGNIDVILFEPLMGGNYLATKIDTVRNWESGGGGFVLFGTILEEIQKLEKKPKIIFHTLASQNTLKDGGFSQDHLRVYFRKPTKSTTLIEEIKKS